MIGELLGEFVGRLAGNLLGALVWATGIGGAAFLLGLVVRLLYALAVAGYAVPDAWGLGQ